MAGEQLVLHIIWVGNIIQKRNQKSVSQTLNQPYAAASETYPLFTVSKNTHLSHITTHVSSRHLTQNGKHTPEYSPSKSFFKLKWLR
jgi:hypothetical protein